MVTSWKKPVLLIMRVKFLLKGTTEAFDWVRTCGIHASIDYKSEALTTAFFLFPGSLSTDIVN